MTTILINLKDEVAHKLVEAARERNITAEELAAQSIEQLFQGPDEEFLRIARRVINEDRELLKRLA